MSAETLQAYASVAGLTLAIQPAGQRARRALHPE